MIERLQPERAVRRAGTDQASRCEAAATSTPPAGQGLALTHAGSTMPINVFPAQQSNHKQTIEN
jgi:hypothetical protein